MFLLFGTSKDYKEKPGGKILNMVCPFCKKATRLVEQIQVESIHIFFIPVMCPG